jgi:23S rRNA (adenine2503-C2)-methyltransferase
MTESPKQLPLVMSEPRGRAKPPRHLADLTLDERTALATELGLPAGPALGRILSALFERVIEEPRLNDRPTLMLLARDLAERSAAEPGR